MGLEAQHANVGLARRTRDSTGIQFEADIVATPGGDELATPALLWRAVVAGVLLNPVLLLSSSLLGSLLLRGLLVPL